MNALLKLLFKRELPLRLQAAILVPSSLLWCVCCLVVLPDFDRRIIPPVFWWCVFWATPAPLTLWGCVFATRFGPKCCRANPGDTRWYWGAVAVTSLVTITWTMLWVIGTS